MIVASPWCYAAHFIECARDFIEALSKGDYGAALGMLDARERRWTREEFVRALRAHTSGAITTPNGLKRSAEPTCASDADSGAFEVVHRLPIDGKWSDVALLFRFVRGKGEYFHVHLLGVETISRRR